MYNDGASLRAEDITYEVIMQRMLDRVSDNNDKREGSIIWDALAPAAVELKLMYIEFDDILNESFAGTASREFLIRRAAERGIKPFPETNAILQGKFTPENIDNDGAKLRTLIGKRFNQPNAPVNYIVTGIIEPGIYLIECETAGECGNQYLGAIVPIDYIDGLQTAELTAVLIPGEDEEDVESLRNRYFSSFDEKAYGGNRRDYLDKTNSIPGVGGTKVTPLWNGGGTVKLTIIDSSFNKASPALLETVQQIIDPTKDGQGVGVAPIGHIVTVETVNEAAVDISVEIAFEEGYTWERTELQAVEIIQEYLLELRKTWASQTNLVIRVSQIETRLLAIQGIIDVTNTQINGSTANLTLDANTVPVYGGISV